MPRAAIAVVILGLALSLVAAQAGGRDWGPPYIEKVSPGNDATAVARIGITYAVFTEAMEGVPPRPRSPSGRTAAPRSRAASTGMDRPG